MISIVQLIVQMYFEKLWIKKLKVKIIVMKYFIINSFLDFKMVDSMNVMGQVQEF